jgi:hypothetical protein
MTGATPCHGLGAFGTALKVERKRVLGPQRRYYYEHGRCLNDHESPSGRCQECKRQARRQAYWCQRLELYFAAIAVAALAGVT